MRESETGTTLWKTRLLTGSFAGQEMVLPAGKTRWGNDELCDFIIAGTEETDGVFGFDLDVTDNGVLLSGVSSSVQDKVIIDDEPVNTDRLENGLTLERKQRVSIDGVSFVTGMKNDNLADLPTKKRQRKKDKPAKKTGQKQTGKLMILLVSACVIFLLCAVGLFFLMERNATHIDGKGGTVKTLPEVVEKLKEAEHLDQIKTHWNFDGTLKLSGYSPEATKLKQFTSELDALGIVHESGSVINMDEILKSVRFLLANSGYKNITVRPGSEPGHVVISGNIIGDQQWENTTDQMTNDIKGLKGWSVENNQSDFSTVLLEAMKKNDLSDKLAVVDKGQSVIITGKLSSGQVAVLNKALENARVVSHSAPEVIYQNIPYSGELYPEYLPSPVASYGGNEKNAWLILVNGIRCGVGTLLPSGYRIVDISDSGITFRRAGLMAHFPIVV